jgi:uncharacterized membrane protein
MTLLIVGLVLFFGVHSIAIVAPALRARAIRRVGERGWRVGYALLSAGSLALFCYGFALARHAPVILYSPAPWLRHVAFLLMLPVFPLIISAYLPGRIKTAVKHPMLVAIKCWALAHLLANGSLADVLLFGGFLAWAVADRISLKRRAALQVLRTAAPGPWNDLSAVLLGLAFYALMIGWLHARLFGVSPLG